MFKPMHTREEFLNSCITPATSSPFASTECPICQEEYRDSTSGCAVTFSDDKTCNHVFCKACITTWLSDVRVNTCALCRRVLFISDDPWATDDEDSEDSYDDDDDDYDDDDNDEQEEEEERHETVDSESDIDSEESDSLLSDSEVEDGSQLRLRVPAADRNQILPQEIILQILASVFYKTWWLLGSYRSYVVNVRDNPHHPREGLSIDSGDILLPTPSTLVRALLVSCVALGISIGHLGSDEEMDILNWLVNDVAGSVRAHIDTTGGTDDVPGFPLWKQRIWGEPLQWLLASAKDASSAHESFGAAWEG